VFAIALLAMGGTLASLNGCGGTSTTPHSTGKIQHVVVIFQENRTPDNLFQGLCTANGGVPGCGTSSTQYDLAQSGTDSNHNTVQLQEVNLGVTYNPDHSHTAFNAMCDLNTTVNPPQCQMDGADKIAVNCPTGMTECAFAYVNPADVQPYLQLAEQYTFADRMFQTNQGPSLPAHQFIISGTSAPTAGSNLFASENPKTSGPPDGGCDAPVGSTIKLIDPTGSETSNAAIYPCFEHPTLTDLLEAKGATWRYYTSSGYAGGSGTALWVGPEAIQHICGSTSSGACGGADFTSSCGGADFTSHVILNQTQILTDINNHQLPDVSWVIPTGQASDHAGSTGNTQGPSWVASVVNAIGNSSYWANTAIFITWDDWGGWFDHVAPPQVLVNCAQWGCGYVYGFRVPLIVVSPYAKAKYISKNQHDFGSILKFIEGIFSLPSLGYADAAADDLSDCFDLNQTPLPFHTIAAPLDAQYFLNDKTPPTNPDDD
jgi:phospholipase C